MHLKNKLHVILVFIKTYTINENNLLVALIFILFPVFILPNYINPIIIPRFYFITVLSAFCLLSIIQSGFNFKKNYFIILAILLILLAISCFHATDRMSAWLGISKLMGFTAKNGSKSILFIGNVYYYTGFITYVICSILFILGAITSNPEKLVKYLIISTAVVAIVSILQFAGFNIYNWGTNSKSVSGTMGNPNFLATLMVFVLPASILLYLFTNKTVWLLCSGLIFGGLQVSYTRGAWLTFIGIFTIIVFYTAKSSFKNKLQKMFKLILVFAIVLTILLPMNNGILRSRGQSIDDEILNSLKLNDNGGSYRIYIYKNVFKVIKGNWLLGAGLDNLIYEKIVMPNGSVVAKAHSNILELAATAGIPAALVYFLFMALIFKNYQKGNRPQFLYLLMSLSYLVQGLINIDMIMVYPLFWIILGLSVASREEQDKNIQNLEIVTNNAVKVQKIQLED